MKYAMVLIAITLVVASGCLISACTTTTTTGPDGSVIETTGIDAQTAALLIPVIETLIDKLAKNKEISPEERAAKQAEFEAKIALLREIVAGLHPPIKQMTLESPS